ncbi:hypothetical protein WJX72_004873 [[Myrmecia] bisecta]|uniref:Protein kinase domain-containing protein n=1 Tax=[Myrmecia] bisecta TaxID=41462 RepID=A0AAW1QEX3_9CHLO
MQLQDWPASAPEVVVDRDLHVIAAPDAPLPVVDFNGLSSRVRIKGGVTYTQVGITRIRSDVQPGNIRLGENWLLPFFIMEPNATYISSNCIWVRSCSNNFTTSSVATLQSFPYAGDPSRAQQAQPVADGYGILLADVSLAVLHVVDGKPAGSGLYRLNNTLTYCDAGSSPGPAANGGLRNVDSNFALAAALRDPATSHISTTVAPLARTLGDGSDINVLNRSILVEPASHTAWNKPTTLLTFNLSAADIATTGTVLVTRNSTVHYQGFVVTDFQRLLAHRSTNSLDNPLYLGNLSVQPNGTVVLANCLFAVDCSGPGSTLPAVAAQLQGLTDVAGLAYPHTTEELSVALVAVDLAPGASDLGLPSGKLMIESSTFACMSRIQAGQIFVPSTESAGALFVRRGWPPALTILAGLVVLGLLGGFVLHRRRQRRKGAAYTMENSLVGCNSTLHESQTSLNKNNAAAAASAGTQLPGDSGKTHTRSSATSIDIGEFPGPKVRPPTASVVLDRARVSLNKHEIVLGPLLGRGSYGKVYKGSWKGQQVAVKIIEHREAGSTLQQMNSAGQKENSHLDWAREAAIAAGISHPNVVATYRTCTEQMTANYRSHDGQPAKQLFETWMAMEYCDRGSLFEAKQDNTLVDPATGKRNLRDVVSCLVDIALAMDFLHSVPMIHGDLKPANVLLKTVPKGSNSRGFECKVADFGLSRAVAAEGHYHTQTIGTVAYMPPEVLLDGNISLAADVYSFGILMWALFTGTVPYTGLGIHQVIFKVIYQHARPDFPGELPPPVYAALMQKCWSQEPRDRPRFPQILQELGELQASLYADAALSACTSSAPASNIETPQPMTGQLHGFSRTSDSVMSSAASAQAGQLAEGRAPPSEATGHPLVSAQHPADKAPAESLASASASENDPAKAPVAGTEQVVGRSSTGPELLPGYIRVKNPPPS